MSAPDHSFCAHFVLTLQQKIVSGERKHARKALKRPRRQYVADQKSSSEERITFQHKIEVKTSACIRMLTVYSRPNVYKSDIAIATVRPKSILGMFLSLVVKN